MGVGNQFGDSAGANRFRAEGPRQRYRDEFQGKTLGSLRRPFNRDRRFVFVDEFDGAAPMVVEGVPFRVNPVGMREAAMVIMAVSAVNMRSRSFERGHPDEDDRQTQCRPLQHPYDSILDRRPQRQPAAVASSRIGIGSYFFTASPISAALPTSTSSSPSLR